ncbi:MAG: CRTAC1 family protein [Marinicellaceae bacterium]
MKILIILASLSLHSLVASKTESLDLISNFNMFDVGLAQINHDKYYDIFTVNQENAESVLINKDGKFVESGLTLGLKQTADMPDYESTGRSPKIKDGLNIYTAVNDQLIIYCHKCDQNVKGSVKFPTPKNEKNNIEIIHQESAVFEKKYKPIAGRAYVIADFELEKSGLIVIDVHFIDTNIEFEIDTPAEKIFLGENSISPETNNFTMSSRDNHSFAWTRLNNDNFSDVYMSSGGLKSRIKEFHPRAVIPGLLYVKHAGLGKFENKYKKSQIFKENCITYRSEWVDVDSDGDLDLFQGCRNGINQMYRQYGVGPGKFENIAIDFNFGFYHGEEFEWIDWNRDQAIDLLLIQKDSLYIYKNKISRHQRPIISRVDIFPDLGTNLHSNNSSIRTFDINNNGTAEIFVSTKEALHYFEMDANKRYKKKEITGLNLPKDLSGNINIIDVNLDGLADIVAYESGIFLQKADNTFEKSTLYPELFVKRNNRYKNLIWFDADINGQWDVLNAESYLTENYEKKTIKLMSYEYQDIPKWDHLNLHRNLSSSNKNNWLQIDLQGTSFNRDAIGAVVTVTAENGLKQTRYNHGTSDSIRSQGHYRLYFGLKDIPKVDITVNWPDGTVTTRKDIKSNRLLTIKHQTQVTEM